MPLVKDANNGNHIFVDSKMRRYLKGRFRLLF